MEPFYVELKEIQEAIINIVSKFECNFVYPPVTSFSKYEDLLFDMQNDILQGVIELSESSRKCALAVIYRLLTDLACLHQDINLAYCCIKLAFHHLLGLQMNNMTQILKCEAGLKLVSVTVEMREIADSKFICSIIDGLIASMKFCEPISVTLYNDKYFQLYQNLIQIQCDLKFKKVNSIIKKMKYSVVKYKLMCERLKPRLLAVTDEALRALKQQIEFIYLDRITWIDAACGISSRLSPQNNFRASWYLIHVSHGLLMTEKDRPSASHDLIRISEGRIMLVKVIHMYNLLKFSYRLMILRHQFKIDFNTLQNICDQLKANLLTIPSFDFLFPIEPLTDTRYDHPITSEQEMKRIFMEAIECIEKIRNVLSESELQEQNYSELYNNLYMLRNKIM